MIPISVITLIQKYKSTETLYSIEEWFYEERAKYIILDDYILKNKEFYELLTDKNRLEEVLLELRPQGLNYSESVLAAVQSLEGVILDQDKIKSALFNYTGIVILTYYLQWGWFREYIRSLLPQVKEHVIKTSRPLRWVFNSDYKRRALLEEYDDFVVWFVSNFFIGHPSVYCDMVTFVSCCSSHYDFYTLNKYGQTADENKLAEYGAVYEAIKNNRIWSVDRLPKIVVPVLLDITLEYFPETITQSLVLARKSLADNAFYASLALSGILDYSLEFLSALLRVIPEEEFVDIFMRIIVQFDALQAGFSEDSLSGIRSVLLQLKELLCDQEVLFNHFSHSLLSKSLDFIDNNESLLTTLIEDGLIEWLDDLSSHSIVIPKNKYRGASKYEYKDIDPQVYQRVENELFLESY
jgi:hypothetical protein